MNFRNEGAFVEALSPVFFSFVLQQEGIFTQDGGFDFLVEQFGVGFKPFVDGFVHQPLDDDVNEEGCRFDGSERGEKHGSEECDEQGDCRPCAFPLKFAFVALRIRVNLPRDGSRSLKWI